MWDLGNRILYTNPPLLQCSASGPWLSICQGPRTRSGFHCGLRGVLAGTSAPHAHTQVPRSGLRRVGAAEVGL